jgi:CRP-like cAMP-binding protein
MADEPVATIGWRRSVFGPGVFGHNALSHRPESAGFKRDNSKQTPPWSMSPALNPGMVDRDFFGFCITLKPLEMKAIGELSETRHLGAGETVYAPGDPGDTFFIITRGVVEAVRSSDQNVSDTYLSRGDIFGDVEVLTERPRKYLVRTRDPASLQCFHRKDFPELIRRVPSFFQYLSEQLAFRLAQARDLAVTQSRCLELSGSLSNFDLVTIYQTISNSAQTGELRICNEKSDLISAFFFEKGQPRCGQFEHLTGEEAFWQLFLSDSLAGTFSFSSGERPVNAWIQSEPITRNAGDMLINALQGRDEFHDLQQRMPDAEEKLHRRKLNLSWPAAAARELQPIAEQIWPLAYNAPVTLNGLFRSGTVCELKIYQVVDELVQSKHFEWACGDLAHKVA